MKAWIARDKDGGLYLYRRKPRKHAEYERWFSKYSIWLDWSERLFLARNFFPQVKWEDKEPTEVKIIIKEKGE